MTDTQPSGAESALDLDSIMTWKQRMDEFGHYVENGLVSMGWGAHVAARDAEIADLRAALARRATAPHASQAPAEVRNITQIERTSDQSVRVTFTSARAASAFSASLGHAHAAPAAQPVEAGSAVPDDWKVFKGGMRVTSGALFDVVLKNGVTEYGRPVQLIDWTQVRDWRYAATHPAEPVEPAGGALVAKAERDDLKVLCETLGGPMPLQSALILANAKLTRYMRSERIAATTESAAAPADLGALIAEHRIGLTPENEGGFHAHVYGDSETPVASGYGPTPREAVETALLATQQPTTQGEGKPLTRCAAGRDGECNHRQCPQLRDGEPAKSGRHCPIDIDPEEA